MQEHRVEGGPVVPTMLSLLLAQPFDDYDLSSLRILGSGGAPLPAALREEAERRLGVTLFEGYGLTESSAAATACTPRRTGPAASGARCRTPGSPSSTRTASRSRPARWARSASAGTASCSATGTTRTRPRRRCRDGWLNTGDLGRLDDDGFLFIVDRKKDLIIRGGFNVFPRDVEDVLMSHPDVTSAAVVGRPDAEKGEEVVAVVALRPGAAAGQEDLMEHAAARLAAYKYPREIRVVDAVPVTSVGKTDRRAVRQLVTG